MNETFLLNTPLAHALYGEVKDLPIIDYHNHLSVHDIVADRVFGNITQLWITPDPYKHRAMRILGVPERFITGDASDLEKFERWYACLPRLIGNPLYDWSMMEFERVLGISLDPMRESAERVWGKANEAVRSLSAQALLSGFNIEYCAPCTALCDDLSVFGTLGSAYAPSLRGDDIVASSGEFVKALARTAGIAIDGLDAWEAAVEQRLLAFEAVGCRYTDHALDDGFDYIPDDGGNEDRFRRAARGEMLSQTDRVALSSHLLRRLGGLYARHGFTMQLHIGAKRQTSTRLCTVAGPAGGYAAIGSTVHVNALVSLLDDIEQGAHGLPKTVLFTLNPADNAVMSILSGSFSRDGTEAVVSQGPAWWWCDHRQGMREMLEHLSVYGVLSTFVGMTTDSRSLLSFVRHDYFRRVLCAWIAEEVEHGAMPNDLALLSDTVKRICYGNARKTVFRAE